MAEAFSCQDQQLAVFPPLRRSAQGCGVPVDGCAQPSLFRSRLVQYRADGRGLGVQQETGLGKKGVEVAGIDGMAGQVAQEVRVGEVPERMPDSVPGNGVP